MYGIFTYIWLIFMVNVGIYTIHGSSGKRKHLFLQSNQYAPRLCKFTRFTVIGSRMKLGLPNKFSNAVPTKNPQKIEKKKIILESWHAPLWRAKCRFFHQKSPKQNLKHWQLLMVLSILVLISKTESVSFWCPAYFQGQNDC